MCRLVYNGTVRPLTAPARQSYPASGEYSAHLWWGQLPHDDEPELRAVLSPAEQARAACCALEKERQRFLRRRAFVRRVLARYAKTDPQHLEFSSGMHGKPRLAGCDENRLEFNLSHTRDYVALAVTKRRRIGADIEYSARARNFVGIAKSCFSAREQAYLHRVPPELRGNAFYSLWTRKEALLKACGCGLAVPSLAEVCVLPEGEKMDFKTASSVFWKEREWTICNITLLPNLTCAVAIEGRGCKLQVRALPAGEVWRQDA